LGFGVVGVLLEFFKEATSELSVFPLLREFDESTPAIPVLDLPVVLLATPRFLLPTPPLCRLGVESTPLEDRSGHGEHFNNLADLVLERTFPIAPFFAQSRDEEGFQRKDQLARRDSFLPPSLARTVGLCLFLMG
jgi:hypothetical protein